MHADSKNVKQKMKNLVLNLFFRSDKRDHLIRVDNDFVEYEEDQVSKRLSVIIHNPKPQAGSSTFAVPIKFMCLGSDVGGINRWGLFSFKF